jgi:hypothetical protein
MMQLEQFEALMSSLGPVLDPLDLTYHQGEKVWSVQCDEETAVLVDFVEEQATFVLTCEIGRPAPGDRFKLYELLLRYNYHWRHTDGGRMALDENDGNVVFLFERSAQGLDVPHLAMILRNLHDTALAWRGLLHSGANQSQIPAEQMFSSMIRG